MNRAFAPKRIALPRARHTQDHNYEPNEGDGPGTPVYCCAKATGRFCNPEASAVYGPRPQDHYQLVVRCG
ncbi:hypothetical protein BOSE62_80019 [Bosea sp. 62]|nr:hypothetical protein BOSE46_80111 [Bosea sp. 46]VXB07437.1 hypothetical protein BOSE125_120005 [Bosea sp. 125]VXC70440.1 hypothetical protein BOSE29B_70116 [Bosea sp. 29B]VXC95063.1 hypothetical protein BOSE62_80019 [Bosea sp. 62]